MNDQGKIVVCRKIAGKRKDKISAFLKVLNQEKPCPIHQTSRCGITGNVIAIYEVVATPQFVKPHAVASAKADDSDRPAQTEPGERRSEHISRVRRCFGVLTYL